MEASGHESVSKLNCVSSITSSENSKQTVENRFYLQSCPKNTQFLGADLTKTQKPTLKTGVGEGNERRNETAVVGRGSWMFARCRLPIN